MSSYYIEDTYDYVELNNANLYHKQKLNKGSRDYFFDSINLANEFSNVLKDINEKESKNFMEFSLTNKKNLNNFGTNTINVNKKLMSRSLHDLTKNINLIDNLDEFDKIESMDDFIKKKLPNHSNLLRDKIKKFDLERIPIKTEYLRVGRDHVGKKRKRQKIGKDFYKIVEDKQDDFPINIKVNYETYDYEDEKNKIKNDMSSFEPIIKVFNEFNEKVNKINEDNIKFREDSIKDIINLKIKKIEEIKKNIYTKLKGYFEEMYGKRNKEINTKIQFVTEHFDKRYKKLFDNYKKFIKNFVNVIVLRQIKNNEKIKLFFEFKKEFSKKVKDINAKIVEIDSNFAKFSMALKTKFSELKLKSITVNSQIENLNNRIRILETKSKNKELFNVKEKGNLDKDKTDLENSRSVYAQTYAKTVKEIENIVNENLYFYNDYVKRYNTLNDTIGVIIKNQKMFNQRLESQESKIVDLYSLSDNFRDEITLQLKTFEMRETSVLTSLQGVNNDINQIRTEINKIWIELKKGPIKFKERSNVENVINTTNDTSISLSQYLELLHEINKLKGQINNNTGFVNKDEVQRQIQSIRNEMFFRSNRINSNLNSLYNRIKTDVFFNLKSQISNEISTLEDNLFNQNRLYMESNLLNRRLSKSVNFNVGIQDFSKEFDNFKSKINIQYSNFYTLFAKKLKEYQEDEDPIEKRRKILLSKKEITPKENEELTRLDQEFKELKKRVKTRFSSFIKTKGAELTKSLKALSDKVEKDYNGKIEEKNEELKKSRILLADTRKDLNESNKNKERLFKEIKKINEEIENLKIKGKPDSEIFQVNKEEDMVRRKLIGNFNELSINTNKFETSKSNIASLLEQINNIKNLYANLKKELNYFKSAFIKDVNKNFLEKTFKNTEYMTALFHNFMERNKSIFNNIFDVMFKKKFDEFNATVNTQYQIISDYYKDDINRNKELFKNEFDTIAKNIKEKEIVNFEEKISGFDKRVTDFEEKSVLLSKNITEFNKIIDILVKSEVDSEDKGLSRENQTNVTKVKKDKENMTNLSNTMFKGFIKLKAVIDILYKSKEFKGIMKIRKELTMNTDLFSINSDRLLELENNLIFNKNKYEKLQNEVVKSKNKLEKIEEWKNEINEKYKNLFKDIKFLDAEVNVMKYEFGEKIKKNLEMIIIEKEQIVKLITGIKKETDKKFKIYDKSISDLEIRIADVNNELSAEIYKRVKTTVFDTAIDDIKKMINLIIKKEEDYKIEISEDDDLYTKLFKLFDPVIYITPHYGQGSRPDFFYEDQKEQRSGCYNYSEKILKIINPRLIFEIDRAEKYVTIFTKKPQYIEIFHRKKQQLIITKVINMTIPIFLSDHLKRFKNLVTLILKNLNITFESPGEFFKHYITGYLDEGSNPVPPYLKKLNYLQISLNNFNFKKRRTSAYVGYYGKKALTHLEICNVEQVDLNEGGKIHMAFYYIRGKIYNIYISAPKLFVIPDEVINRIKTFESIKKIEKFIIFNPYYNNITEILKK